MPRLALILLKNHDAHMYRAATAVEAGALSYMSIMDTLGTRQSPMVRGLMAAAIWYGYSEFVDNLQV